MDSATVLAGLVLERAARLNDLLELLVAIGNMLEELSIDLSKLCCHLSGQLVLVRLLLQRLGKFLSLALSRVKVLLTLGFALENVAHDLLFTRVQRVIVEGAAHRHHGDGTVTITNSSHRAIDLDRCQYGIRDFLGVGDLILSVEEVPDIQETVHAGQEEKTGAGW